SRFVARFIGAGNVIDGKRVADREIEVAGRRIAIGQGEMAAPGEAMSFCVKTHDLELVAGPGAEAACLQSGGNCLPGIVRGQAYLGSHRDYIVDVGQELLVAAPPELHVPVGSKVHVKFAAERCRGLVQ
ncbi:MAG TPA: TOBE domain-containing protein, partial [Usitatibacter sp.]